jgi:hypothetical protein
MLHIIFLLLCSSISLFAGQIAALTASSTAPETIFGKLNVRPMDIQRVHQACANVNEDITQQFLPHYTNILAMITQHAPLEQIVATMHDETTFATLHKEHPSHNRLALFFQHNIHALMAYAYLQHNKFDKAYISTTSALGITAAADLIDQFGCPAHSPLTALAADHVLQHMHPFHRAQNDLTVIGGHIAAARAYMDKEIALKGPWTNNDMQLLQWYTAATSNQIAPAFNIATFVQLQPKIQQASSKLYGLFLATQVEASMQAMPANAELIRTAARTYAEYLFQKDSYDPDDEALRFLCIAAQHNDYLSAFKVGNIFLQRANDAVTIDDKKKANLLASSYFKKAAAQSENRKLADKAAFNEAKIANPYHDDEIKNTKQIVNQLTALLKRKGNNHFLAPLMCAYLATYYGTLIKQEPSKTVKKRYQDLKKTYTLMAKNSGNILAINYLDCQELNSRTLDDLDTILARSTKYNGKVKPDLDMILATFDHTLGFENIRQAAHAWVLRAKAALKETRPNGMDCVKCLLKAYELDQNYPLTISLIRNYMNEHVHAGDIERAELFLDELDKLQKNARTIYWRGNLEQKKGNIQRAIELFEQSGTSRALYNVGSIYYRGSHDIEKNLSHARAYFEKAAHIEPMEALYTRALADIAAEENRHNDRYKLLQKVSSMTGCTALDAYNLVKLSLNGHIIKATAANTYTQLITVITCATREKPCTLTEEQLEECADITTCLRLQLHKANAQEMKQLFQLEQKGVQEAYHALAYQIGLTAEAKAAEPGMKQQAIKTARLYMQKALDKAPHCNRTLLRLAELTTPTTLCPIDTMSEADKIDLEYACTLYEHVLTAPTNNAYAAQAHVHLALMLAHAYQEPALALAHFNQAARLGSSNAYLSLLGSSVKNYREIQDSPIKERIYRTANELLSTDIVYDDFTTTAARIDFNKRVAEAKAVFQPDNSSSVEQTLESNDATLQSDNESEISYAASSNV